MRWKRIAWGVCGIIVVLMMTLYCLFSRYDFNRLKPEICGVVRGLTGRELTFGGDIHLTLGLTPVLAVDDVSFQNATWGSRPHMARISRLEVHVAVLPLIFGKIELRQLVLVGPDILIETDKAGRSNLEFGRVTQAIPEKPGREGVTGGIRLPALVLNELQVIRGVVTYREGPSGKVYSVSLDSLTAFARNYESPLRMEIHGSYRNIPIRVKGTFGSLSGLLRENQEPWPLGMNVEALQTSLDMEGTIKDARNLCGTDLRFALEGKELAALGEAFGKLLPLRGPFSVSGRMSDTGPRTYKISDLKASAGGSELEGTLEASLMGRRPKVKAVLKSPKLDLRPLFAERPGSGEHQGEIAGRRVFPDRPLPIRTLQSLDADVEIVASQVFFPKLSANQVRARTNLKEGRLLVQPLSALVAGGILDAQLDLESQGEIGVIGARLRVDRLDAGQVLRAIQGKDVMEGQVDISVDVWSRGRSIAEWMGGLHGRTALVMGQGKIYNRTIDLVGADVSSIFRDLFSPSKQGQPYTPVDCLVTGFSVQDGLAETTALVLETEQLSIVGDGEINLKTERLNLRLNSMPRGGLGARGVGKVTLSLGAMVKSFRLTGTIAQPSLGVDTLQSVLTVGKLVGGTLLLGPLGLLAPLVTTGEVESPCSMARRAAMEGIKMSDLAKQEGKGTRLVDLPGEGLKEIGRGFQKLFGK